MCEHIKIKYTQHTKSLSFLLVMSIAQFQCERQHRKRVEDKSLAKPHSHTTACIHSHIVSKMSSIHEIIIVHSNKIIYFIAIPAS